MFLLPPKLRQLLGKKQEGQNSRVFSLDEKAALTLTRLAKERNRAEDEILEDVIEAGLDRVLGANEFGDAWASLSFIEQEITALLGMGWTSYEIASTLNVSYDTVRYHSKHIYKAFGLDRKGLLLALKKWELAEWWDSHH